MIDKKDVLLPDGEIEFHFEKSNFFRVIHVDGAFGGISPSTQMIHMSIFSERQPIPKKVGQKIQHGVLGAEILEKRESRTGIFRELEADLVISPKVAIALRGWLDERINEAQLAREIMEQAQKEAEQ
jgi:hypothetical protein